MQANPTLKLEKNVIIVTFTLTKTTKKTIVTPIFISITVRKLMKYVFCDTCKLINTKLNEVHELTPTQKEQLKEIF